MLKAILGALVLWPLHFASFVLLGTLGLLVIPTAALLKRTEVRYSKKYRWDPAAQHVTTGIGLPHQIVAFKDRFIDFIWGNEEDGVDGAYWFRRDNPEFTQFRRIVQWSAVRNPVNNVRFNLGPPSGGMRLRSSGRSFWGNSETPSEDLRTNPDRIFWHFSSQSWFAGFWLIIKINEKRHFRFRLGWKIPKGDIPPTDYRSAGVGFAIQFTPYRKG